MSARDNGGPAFPTEDRHAYIHGMSLRDYFAAQAAAGNEGNIGANGWSAEKTAARAYKVADAMLAERMKGINP